MRWFVDKGHTGKWSLVIWSLEFQNSRYYENSGKGEICMFEEGFTWELTLELSCELNWVCMSDDEKGELRKWESEDGEGGRGEPKTLGGGSRRFLLAKVGDKVGGIKSGSTFVLREAQGKQEVVLQMKLELAIRKTDGSTLFALVTFRNNLSYWESWSSRLPSICTSGLILAFLSSPPGVKLVASFNCYNLHTVSSICFFWFLPSLYWSGAFDTFPSYYCRNPLTSPLPPFIYPVYYHHF